MLKIHFRNICCIWIVLIDIFPISWCRSSKITHKFEGFYETKYVRNNKSSVCLALLVDPEGSKQKLEGRKAENVPFQTHRPHTGTHLRFETLGEVLQRGRKISVDKAQKIWEEHHESSRIKCSHDYWKIRCINKTIRLICDVRTKFLYITCLIFRLFSPRGSNASLLKSWV